MKVGLICSATLHLAVLLLVFYGVSFPVKDVNHDYAIVAEVVPMSAITNIKTKQNSAKIADEKQTTPPPAPEVKPAPPQKPDEKLAPKAEQKKPAAAAPHDAEKIPDKKTTEKQPKLAATKPAPDKDKKKDVKKPSDPDDFAKSILKSLTADAKKSDDAKKIDKDFKDLEKSLKGDTNKAYNPNIPMSINEVDGIRSQIISKWNTAAFSGSAEKGLQVVIKITLDVQGNVLTATPEGATARASAYYQPFVESAIRAVRLASPIKNLSADKYGSWKEIEFRFDSSGMVY